MTSLTIDRAALSLPDLVITDNPFVGDFHLPEDGVSWPDWSMRRSYAPDSAYVAGRTLLTAVREASSLPLVIYAHGDTAAELAVAKAALEAATSQWDYTLTLTVDGVAHAYRAEPELPTWGAVDSGMVRARMARASIVVPVNP